MQNLNILEKIGLNHKQSAIYMALVESVPCTISDLYKKTGIHRPLLYKEIPVLEKIGLINIMPKGKRKYYIAESPEKLKNLTNELVSGLETALPELISVFQSKKQKPVIKYLEGRKGITFVFDDIITTLKRGEIYYRYTSESREDLYKVNKYLPKDFRKRRDNNQIERFVICNESTFARKKQTEVLTRSLKMVPKSYDLFEYDISEFIYGHKVAYVDYNTETALIIENQKFAEFQKKIFKLLYKNL